MPFIDVMDTRLHYTATGSGQPVVLLHGNPTSSHLWRNVIPHLGQGVAAYALDLVGMGESGKPSIAYDFIDHARYVGAWIEAMRFDRLVLVGHDWGGALALDWAATHPARVRGVVFFETIVRPMSWDDLPVSAQPVFRMLRGAGTGERAVLEDNLFIEQALPGTIRGLNETDHQVYRSPYPTAESRRPLLQWPRSMPIDGEPADVVARVERYDRWLQESTGVPKLVPTFHDGPGLMGPAVEQWICDNCIDVEMINCGVAGHHAPEDQPEAIGRAIGSWMRAHQLTDSAVTDGDSQ